MMSMPSTRLLFFVALVIPAFGWHMAMGRLRGLSLDFGDNLMGLDVGHIDDLRAPGDDHPEDEDDDPDLIPSSMLPTPEKLGLANASRGSAPWHEAMKRRLATRSLPTIYQIREKIISINGTLDQVGDMVEFLNDSVSDIVGQVIDGANQTLDALDQINQAAEAAAAFGADDIGTFITSFALYMRLQVEDLQSKMLKAVESQIYDRLDVVISKFTEMKDDIVFRFNDIIAQVLGMVKAAAEHLPSADPEPEPETFARQSGNLSELANASNTSEFEDLVRVAMNKSDNESFVNLVASNASESASLVNVSDAEDLERLVGNASESVNSTEQSPLSVLDAEVELAHRDPARALLLRRMEHESQVHAGEGMNESVVMAIPQELAEEKLDQLNRTVTMVANLLAGLNLTAVDMVMTNVLGAAKTNLEAIDSQCFGAVESAGGAVPDLVKPMMKILCSAPLKLLDQLQPKVDEVISMISVKVDEASAGLEPLVSAITDLSQLVEASRDVSNGE